MDDYEWFEEFGTFYPPHASDYVRTVKQCKKLQEVNHNFDQTHADSTVNVSRSKVVRFDSIVVIFHFKN
jgi:hypothetical protein